MSKPIRQIIFISIFFMSNQIQLRERALYSYCARS